MCSEVHCFSWHVSEFVCSRAPPVVTYMHAVMHEHNSRMNFQKQKNACCAVSEHVATSAHSVANSRAAYSHSTDVSSQASKLERCTERCETAEGFEACETEPCMLSTMLQPNGPPELAETGPKSAPLIVSSDAISSKDPPERSQSARDCSRRIARKGAGHRESKSSQELFARSDFATALADRLNEVLATRGGYNGHKVLHSHLLVL